jgi:hypothetical protein
MAILDNLTLFWRWRRFITTILEASRIDGALLHRTWAIDGRPDRRPIGPRPSVAAGRCHLFLLTCGQATQARAGEPALAFTAPGLLWLPQQARGMLQVMAGCEAIARPSAPTSCTARWAIRR